MNISMSGWWGQNRPDAYDVSPSPRARSTIYVDLFSAETTLERDAPSDIRLQLMLKLMKHISPALTVLASFLAMGSSSLADDRTHFFDFLKIEVREVLDIYQQVSGLDLVTDASFDQVSSVPIQLHFDRPLPTIEASRLLEQILAREAEVVITRLDARRALATHHGQLLMLLYLPAI